MKKPLPQKLHLYTFGLVLLPLFLLLINIQLSNNSGPYSVRAFDPDYIYLINGTLMGSTTLNVPHIDNPGTPLHVVGALSTRIAHLFSGSSPYFEDVLENSDKYLNITNLTLVVLVAFMSFVIGLLVFRLTNNILLALLVQITPFCSLTLITGMTRLYPEPYSLIAIFSLTYLVIKYYYDDNSAKDLKKYALQLGLVCGLGLSFKFDLISFYLLPFLFLPGLKIKLRFILIGLLSFFLFAFPVLFDLKFIFLWLKSLLTHTGKYGSGESGLIEINSFIENFKTIFNFYSGFKWVLIVAIAAFLFNIVYKPKQNKKLNKILASSIVTMLFHVFIVSKHFSLNYMIPIVAFFAIPVFLTIESTNKLLPQLKKYMYAAVLILVSITFTHNYKGLLGWKKTSSNLKLEVVSNVKDKVGEHPFLIVANPYNSYFPEQGLVFGYFFSGKYRPKINSTLNKIYPNSYVFDFSQDFLHSGQQVSIDSVLGENEIAYIFIDKKAEHKKDYVLGLLGNDIQTEVAYISEDNGDALYKVIRQSTIQ